jgi:hypothetical protein
MIRLLLDIAGAPSTPAGLVTAVGTVIIALTALVAAVGGLIPILRSTKKMAKTVAATNATVEVVHTIVNQQRTDAQRYNIALCELLKKHGIEIPIDQSLPVVGEPDAKPGQPH